jgi:hypothetical protein
MQYSSAAVPSVLQYICCLLDSKHPALSVKHSCPKVLTFSMYDILHHRRFGQPPAQPVQASFTSIAVSTTFWSNALARLHPAAAAA